MPPPIPGRAHTAQCTNCRRPDYPSRVGLWASLVKDNRLLSSRAPLVDPDLNRVREKLLLRRILTLLPRAPPLSPSRLLAPTLVTVPPPSLRLPMRWRLAQTNWSRLRRVKPVRRSRGFRVSSPAEPCSFGRL